MNGEYRDRDIEVFVDPVIDIADTQFQAQLQAQIEALVAPLYKVKEAQI